MTANETPAALLRRAADRLDETAAETSPEPWATPRVRAVLVPWVALMSVEIAAPLAAWLRAEAQRVGGPIYDDVAAGHVRIEHHSWGTVASTPYAPALALARSILGEAETA